MRSFAYLLAFVAILSPLVSAQPEFGVLTIQPTSSFVGDVSLYCDVPAKFRFEQDPLTLLYEPKSQSPHKTLWWTTTEIVNCWSIFAHDSHGETDVLDHQEMAAGLRPALGAAGVGKTIFGAEVGGTIFMFGEELIAVRDDDGSPNFRLLDRPAVTSRLDLCHFKDSVWRDVPIQSIQRGQRVAYIAKNDLNIPMLHILTLTTDVELVRVPLPPEPVYVLAADGRTLAVVGVRDSHAEIWKVSWDDPQFAHNGDLPSSAYRPLRIDTVEVGSIAPLLGGCHVSVGALTEDGALLVFPYQYNDSSGFGLNLRASHDGSFLIASDLVSGNSLRLDFDNAAGRPLAGFARVGGVRISPWGRMDFMLRDRAWQIGPDGRPDAANAPVEFFAQFEVVDSNNNAARRILFIIAICVLGLFAVGLAIWAIRSCVVKAHQSALYPLLTDGAVPDDDPLDDQEI